MVDKKVPNTTTIVEDGEEIGSVDSWKGSGEPLTQEVHFVDGELTGYVIDDRKTEKGLSLEDRRSAG